MAGLKDGMSRAPLPSTGVYVPPGDRWRLALVDAEVRAFAEAGARDCDRAAACDFAADASLAERVHLRARCAQMGVLCTRGRGLCGDVPIMFARRRPASPGDADGGGGCDGGAVTCACCGERGPESDAAFSAGVCEIVCARCARTRPFVSEHACVPLRSGSGEEPHTARAAADQ